MFDYSNARKILMLLRDIFGEIFLGWEIRYKGKTGI